MPNRRFAIIVTACSFLGFTSLAHAHAHLLSAQPPIDGTVAASPTEIDLKFSEELNLKFTGIKITAAGGAEVKTNNAMLMGGDKTYMASIPGKLAPGKYKVAWHALSQDGHKTQGTYTFTVKP